MRGGVGGGWGGVGGESDSYLGTLGPVYLLPRLPWGLDTPRHRERERGVHCNYLDSLQEISTKRHSDCSIWHL